VQAYLAPHAHPPKKTASHGSQRLAWDLLIEKLTGCLFNLSGAL